MRGRPPAKTQTPEQAIADLVRAFRAKPNEPRSIAIGWGKINELHVQLQAPRRVLSNACRPGEVELRLYPRTGTLNEAKVREVAEAMGLVDLSMPKQAADTAMWTTRGIWIEEGEAGE